MSDNPTLPTAGDKRTTKWVPSTDPDEYTREQVNPKDLLLFSVLNLSHGIEDELDGAIGLTVIVGGQVVSGTAISESTWRSAVTSQWELAGGSEYLGKLFERAAEGNRDNANRRTAANLPVRTRRFLHMRNVVVGSGAEMSLPLWRGSLDDVASWSLGHVAPQSNDQ